MTSEQNPLANALDPDVSVVVEACAGSGKTWLLVSRIVRLLLAGVAPSEILAVTFTRKGAREMQERLNAWLQELATHPDDEWVAKFLRERGVSDVEKMVAQARGLFEKVIAAQPGIKINTFHGWFADLVQRAPLQAGSAKGFTLTESVHALQQQAWQRYAMSLNGAEASVRQQALDDLFRDFGIHNTRKLLTNFLAKRIEWWRFTAGQTDPVSFAIEQLALQSKVDLEADYAATLFNDAGFNFALKALISVLQLGGRSQQTIASALQAATAFEAPAEKFAAITPLLFNKEFEVRDAIQKFCTKSGTPALDALKVATEKLLATQRARVGQRVLCMNQSAFVAGHGLLEHYQQLKNERGLLDFTDIEYAAYSLLQLSDHAEYMQYKLDARYRHILLDEFQDTNPLQWMTLQAWLQASSDAGLRPTVFLVGDPKQSIFHFRRADARLFAHATAFLRREYGARVLQQNVSRRSGRGVLDAVNNVFANTRRLSGFVPHAPYDNNLESAVHLLPLPATIDSDAGSIASEPKLRDLLSVPQAETIDLRRASEAGEVARGISEIVGTWQVQEDGKRRPAQYRDVMILTRSRSHLRTYELALRKAGIPFASARQGGLLDGLEAEDLLALLKFLLRPSDNLSLVQALRAPIFDCSDDDLITLAKTPGEDWWRRLSALEGGASPALIRARTCLARWLQQAPQLPVHDLLDRIYFESALEQRYERAVPPAMAQSVRANLLAFMELSLTLDSGRYPSLGRFLADLIALRSAPDTEAPDEGTLGEIGNVVRILTVHGAKGLEAPVVWIIDASAKPKGDEPYDLLVTWPTGAPQPQHFSFVTKAAERSVALEPFFAEEAAIAAQEDSNLLYVAMTRAKQYLIVSGNEVGKGAGSWYEALSNAFPATSLPVTTIQKRVEHDAPRSRHLAMENEPWYAATASFGQRKPSATDGNRDYGTKLHALLETARDGVIIDAVAARLLAHEDAAISEALVSHARTILKAPQLERFFNPRHFLFARNEVSVIDDSGESLRIDRTVEFGDSVWILDYKSTSNRGSEFAEVYRQQLRRYRLALTQIYSAKVIHCALIFGDGTLEEIP